MGSIDTDAAEDRYGHPDLYRFVSCKESGRTSRAKSSHHAKFGGTKEEDCKFNLPIGHKDRAMEQSDTRSLQQLKRDTEQTRANLMDTVEQLRATVSESASDIRERIRRTPSERGITIFSVRGRNNSSTTPNVIRCKQWPSARPSAIHC